MRVSTHPGRLPRLLEECPVGGVPAAALPALKFEQVVGFVELDEVLERVHGRGVPHPGAAREVEGDVLLEVVLEGGPVAV